MSHHNPTENPRAQISRPESLRMLGVLFALVGFGSLMTSLIVLFLSAPVFNPQNLSLIGTFVLSSILSFDSAIRTRKPGYVFFYLLWATSAFAIALAAAALLIPGAAIPAAIIFLIFSLAETSVAYTSELRGSITIITGLITSTWIALSGSYVTTYLIPERSLGIIGYAILTLVILIFVGLLAVESSSAPLQVRLATAFLAIVILPITVTSLFLNQTAQNRIQEETFSGLSATADQVAVVLDKFITNTLASIRQEADLDALSAFLTPSPDEGANTAASRDMQAAMQLLMTRESDERIALSSYGLLDSSGKNVYDTDPKNIANSEGTSLYFIEPYSSGKPYVSPIVFDGKGNGFIYFSAPVKSKDRRSIIGVLRARYGASVFQRLAVNSSGLYGLDSHVLIINENLIRVADSYKPALSYTAIVPFSVKEIQTLQALNRIPFLDKDPAAAPSSELARYLKSTSPNQTAFLDIESESGQESSRPEMLAFAKMATMPWHIVYLKANYDQRPIQDQQNKIAVLIASVTSMIVGIISILASRALSNPIVSLTQTANRLSAGDLNTRSMITSQNEYGTLGQAFNLMADRLRSLINELEDRVTQRTMELERRNTALVYRTEQLNTVAEVARQIVTSQELLPLLESVTQMISARFGFYHVGIFLLDENKEYAVLRAANSEGGRRMLARSHMLKVDQVGIVGFVTGAGKARIATDVGKDAVFFNNPDLPLTRSEMALPLRIGSEIIGALDVQSTTSDAFSRDDIELFTTLADQVAVAIYNNRLYNETAQALQDAQAVHRQYLRQEWSTEISTRKHHSYRFSAKGIAAEPTNNEDIEQALSTGTPITSSEIQPDGSTKVIMTVPIALRGETIGTIRLQDNGQEREWSDDENRAVQDIANQVGAALETARLFETTTRRAERERKVLEITSRIRATNDPQEMLEIAAAELQKALGATRTHIVVSPQPSSSSGPAAQEDPLPPLTKINRA